MMTNEDWEVYVYLSWSYDVTTAPNLQPVNPGPQQCTNTDCCNTTVIRRNVCTSQPNVSRVNKGVKERFSQYEVIQFNKRKKKNKGRAKGYIINMLKLTKYDIKYGFYFDGYNKYIKIEKNKEE